MNIFFYGWKMRRVFKERLTMSETVQERLRKTYDSIGAASIQKETEILNLNKKTENRKPLKRMILITAVIGLVVALTGVMTYAAVNDANFFQAMFGNQNQKTTEGRVVYEDGQTTVYPEVEREELDESRAEELVGNYVNQIGKTFTCGEYTITIEKNLFDAAGRIGALYLCLEQGGKPIEGIDIAEDDEILSSADTASIYMRTSGLPGDAEGINTLAGNYITYDRKNSTPEKMHMSISYILFSERRKNESLILGFSTEFSKEEKEIELQPDVKSVPAITLYNDEGSTVLGTLSPLGIALHGRVGGKSDPVTLEYADGTRYVVFGTNENGGDIDNTVYGCISNDDRVIYSFNRLVDPKKVTKVYFGDEGNVINIK